MERQDKSKLNADAKKALTPEERKRILARIKSHFKNVPPDVSLADELIAVRRAEAEQKREQT